MDSTGLKEILEFPSEGHLSTCCYYPTREFTTRIRDCELTGDATTVELEFEVSYSASIDSDKVQLWREKQKATYNTDGKSNRLVLDSSKSDLSKEEIDAIYGGEGLGDEKFIKYNNDRLTEIATGPESVRKEWLRRFLGEEEQSSEKAHLRQLLKR